MNFSIIISEYCIVSLVLLAILVITVCIWTARRYNAVSRAVKAEKEEGDLPPVSVVVYTSDDTESLAKTLPRIMQQDYPQFQVVVADDGVYDNTKDFMLEATLKYPNLHYTSVPTGTRNLSRRKLALTLGIKAAKYDYIVTTADNCYPAGNQWLRNMMRNFTPSIDVVIGASNYNFEDDNARGKRTRAYDVVFSKVQYLSAALHGKPYRGDGNNLAYRKESFFSEKGYSRTLNLQNGDDDIFINEIANNENTAVELSPESCMTVKHYDVKKAYRNEKLRYGFTLSYLKTFAKYSTSIITAFRWLIIPAFVAVVLFSGWNILPIIAAVVLIVALKVNDMVMFRKASAALNGRKLLFSIPYLVMKRPFVTLYYKLLTHKQRRANYTSLHKKL